MKAVSNYKHVTFSINNFLYFFIITSLMIDLVSGFFSTRGITSIGIVIKIPFLFLIVFKLLMKLKNFKYYFSVYFVMLFINVLYNTYNHNSFNVLSDFQVGIKPFFVFSLILWIANEIQLNKVNFIVINKVINVLIATIFFNQIFGIFGYGFASYASGIGTTGFFLSGNEYGIYVMLVGSFKLYSLKKTKSKYFILMFIFVLILAITTAIKSAIFGIFIVGVCLLFNLKRGWILFSLSILIAFLSSFLIQNIDYLNKNLAFSRLIWIYENKGLKTLFFSGRDELLNDALDLYLNSNIFDLLLGMGYYRLNILAAHPEMDFFDVLLMFGIFGVIVIYIPFFIILIKRTFSLILSRSFDVKFVGLMATLSLLLSFFAGHFIFSVAVAPILGLILNINKIEDTTNF